MATLEQMKADFEKKKKEWKNKKEDLCGSLKYAIGQARMRLNRMEGELETLEKHDDYELEFKHIKGLAGELGELSFEFDDDRNTNSFKNIIEEEMENRVEGLKSLEDDIKDEEESLKEEEEEKARPERVAVASVLKKIS